MQADGTPATDLQASEIEIRVGDRTRVVRSLRRVTTAPESGTPGAATSIPPPYGTNDNVAVGRRFVLVIDQESFEGGRELLFRNAVEGLLAQLAPGDRAMVAALPFGGVRVPFTSDKIAIRQALTRVAGQRARTETGSALACRTRRFLESLEGFLREQGTRESPLTLVLFTAGLAAPRRDAPAGLSPGMCELQVDQFRRITAAAGAARANVYLASPADVGLGVSPQRATAGGTGDIGLDNPLEGIEHLAGATGGTRLALDATGTASLLRVARESSTYYVAELEPLPGETFGRSRNLGVRVARRGVTVRARPEIALTMTAHATTTRLSVSDLLDSTAALPELRLRVGGFTVRDASGGLRFGVIVEPDAPGAVLASAGAILIEGDVVVGRWFAKDATERPLLGAMAARPGQYRLRVVAIDAGRTNWGCGTIDRCRAHTGRTTAARVLAAWSLARRHPGAAPRIRIRADRHRILRDLWRNSGPPADGEGRSGARSRRAGSRGSAARAVAGRRCPRCRHGLGARRRAVARRLRGPRNHPSRKRRDRTRRSNAPESPALSARELRWRAARPSCPNGTRAQLFSRQLPENKKPASPCVSPDAWRPRGEAHPARLGSACARLRRDD